MLAIHTPFAFLLQILKLTGKAALLHCIIQWSVLCQLDSIAKVCNSADAYGACSKMVGFEYTIIIYA